MFRKYTSPIQTTSIVEILDDKPTHKKVASANLKPIRISTWAASSTHFPPSAWEIIEAYTAPKLGDIWDSSLESTIYSLESLAIPSPPGHHNPWHEENPKNFYVRHLLHLHALVSTSTHTSYSATTLLIKQPQCYSLD